MRTNNPAEVFALKLNQGVFSFPEFVASDPNDASPLNTGITRAEIVLPLFTGGELSGRIDQAKLAAAAASGTSNWVADNAALSAAEAYVMVAQAEEYATLLIKSRETVAAHVKLAGDYVAQGMLVRSELLRAEVELARMDDLVTEAEGRVRIANANLAFRLGAAGGSSWTLAPLPDPRPVATPVDGWLATAADRSDLGSARNLLAAGELEEKVKKAPVWPKLALVAKGELYGDKPFGSTGTSGSIMAVATWNVFQGGADRAAALAAREDARAGREDVARFSDGVRLEVRQAFEEAKTAEARHETAKKALDVGPRGRAHHERSVPGGRREDARSPGRHDGPPRGGNARARRPRRRAHGGPEARRQGRAPPRERFERRNGVKKIGFRCAAGARRVRGRLRPFAGCRRIRRIPRR